MESIVKINGVSFPAPDGYKLDVEPLGSFERNANGLLVGDLVAVKRKITCDWKILDGTYYGALIQAAGPFFVAAEFILPDGEKVAAEMVVSPQSGKLIFRKDGENYWGGVTVSLTER